MYDTFTELSTAALETLEKDYTATEARAELASYRLVRANRTVTCKERGLLVLQGETTIAGPVYHVAAGPDGALMAYRNVYSSIAQCVASVVAAVFE